MGNGGGCVSVTLGNNILVIDTTQIYIKQVTRQRFYSIFHQEPNGFVGCSCQTAEDCTSHAACSLEPGTTFLSRISSTSATDESPPDPGLNRQILQIVISSLLVIRRNPWPFLVLIRQSSSPTDWGWLNLGTFRRPYSYQSLPPDLCAFNLDLLSAQTISQKIPSRPALPPDLKLVALNVSVALSSCLLPSDDLQTCFSFICELL